MRRPLTLALPGTKEPSCGPTTYDVCTGVKGLSVPQKQRELIFGYITCISGKRGRKGTSIYYVIMGGVHGKEDEAREVA